VNFTTALPSTFCAAVANSDANSTGGFAFNSTQVTLNSTTSCYVTMLDFSGTARDPSGYCQLIVAG